MMKAKLGEPTWGASISFAKYLLLLFLKACFLVEGRSLSPQLIPLASLMHSCRVSDGISRPASDASLCQSSFPFKATACHDLQFPGPAPWLTARMEAEPGTTVIEPQIPTIRCERAVPFVVREQFHPAGWMQHDEKDTQYSQTQQSHTHSFLLPSLTIFTARNRDA